jgi:hypothetical protein
MTHADTARSAALMPGEPCPMPCAACERYATCRWCGERFERGRWPSHAAWTHRYGPYTAGTPAGLAAGRGELDRPEVAP